MQNLTISLIQTELHWQQPAENRAMLAEKMAPLAGTTDLVVLPEMFTTGFTMAPEQVAETEQGETLAWLKAQSRLIGAAITGSVAIQSEQGFVNRLFFVTPDDQVQRYDKRHLFRMGDEQNHYTAGDARKVFVFKGWRILPLICYDLRFPVFIRNRDDYDLILCVANWPAPRRHPWRTLLQARAIENLCYVAGVNRIGEDGNQLPYSGDSMLVDFKGEPKIDAQPGEAFVESLELEARALRGFREKFPAFLDADDFALTGL